MGVEWSYVPQDRSDVPPYPWEIDVRRTKEEGRRVTKRRKLKRETVTVSGRKNTVPLSLSSSLPRPPPHSSTSFARSRISPSPKEGERQKSNSSTLTTVTHHINSVDRGTGR